MTKQKLGSIIEVDDYGQIKRAIVSWLSLDDEQRIAFSQRARSFATMNLSVTRALDNRIEFWNHKLSKIQSNSIE